MAKKNQLNSANLDKYKDSILQYGDSIESIESFIEAVRRLPGVYIGSKGDVGWLACIREIFQNAFDEAVREDSPCHYIRFTFDERNQSAVIEDTGRGIPHGMMEKIYTGQHTSSNYTKKDYDYTSGAHGVGAGVALALSKEFMVDSHVLGKAHRIKFEHGVQWDKGEIEIPCPDNRQGTTVYMSADIDLLGHIGLTVKQVYDLVMSIFPLMNLGDEIDFIGIDINGKMIYNEKLVNIDGIVGGLILKTQTPLIAPIIFKDDTGKMRAEIALTYDSSDLTSPEDVSGFGNFTPAIGAHVDGFLDGLCGFLRNYMNKIYLGEKSKLIVSNNDVKTGLKAVVSAAHLTPVFAGQFKGILTNEDIKDFVKRLTYRSMEQWSKVNSNDLQRVCKLIKDIAEIRVKSDKDKVNISKVYKNDVISGDPDKYIPPSKRRGELFIVEGDSAANPAKMGRDVTYQGIFPIRGKLLNAFKTPRDRFLKNVEIASLIHLIGGGYGKDFDINKVKWSKIISMADADPDGSHIDTLILRFVLIYMPDLIRAGKFYKSIPPLYGIKTPKGDRYFATKIDYAQYLRQLFNTKYTLTDVNGVKLGNATAANVFYKNIDYVRNLEVVSNIFAVNIHLLEQILYFYSFCVEMGPTNIIAGMAALEKAKVKTKKKTTKSSTKTTKPKKEKVIKVDSVNEDIDDDDEPEVELEILDTSIATSTSYYIKPTFSIKKLSSVLKKQFPYLKISDVNGTVLIEGLVDSRYQYIFINDKFIRLCIDMLRLIKSNEALMYKIDGQDVTIYQLMKKFESIAPSSVTRYKGLGEQNPDQLAESALLPEKRVLIQYTMESAKEEIAAIRSIDSNKAVLYRDIKITRDDLE